MASLPKTIELVDSKGNKRSFEKGHAINLLEIMERRKARGRTITWQLPEDSNFKFIDGNIKRSANKETDKGAQ